MSTSRYIMKQIRNGTEEKLIKFIQSPDLRHKKAYKDKQNKKEDMKWYRNKVPLRYAKNIGSVLNLNVTTYDICG